MIFFKKIGENSLSCAITLNLMLFFVFLISGCSSQAQRKHVFIAPDIVKAPIGSASMTPGEVNAVLKEINDRNRTIEDDPEWIKSSYSKMMVRRLTNVSEKEFVNYKQYLEDGTAYILVHPAYFTFFHNPEKVVDNSENAPVLKENVIEKMLSLPPKDEAYQVLQAQERRARDFIEFASTREKLLILVVPRNYQEFPGYTYRKGRDEYMRFLNETTNFSKSVLFVESRSPNRGYLMEEDAVRLMEFLLSINIKRILIGGGYIGRCLEDFYVLLTEDFGKQGIYVVPELSDLSPREISRSLARALLLEDGSLDVDVATNNMKNGNYDVQEVRPEIMNLR